MPASALASLDSTRQQRNCSLQAANVSGRCHGTSTLGEMSRLRTSINASPTWVPSPQIINPGFN